MTQIKNYTSNSKNTFDAIQKCLISHKAQSIMFDYSPNGKVKALAFSLDIGGNVVGFRLPARIDKVEAIFYKNKKTRYDWQKAEPLTDNEKEQAYRTAWANIRDWITAQMALIDTEQVKIEEVFLPYAIDKSGQTYFEAISSSQYKLPSGVIEGEVV